MTPNDAKTPPKSTERLSFGIWQEDDIILSDAIWGDAAVTELIGGPFTPKAVAQRLHEEITNWRDHGIQYWPLFQQQDGALMGCCGFRPRNMDEGILELGFHLCRGAWGKGLAFEAAIAAIEWARAHRFASLIAGHHPANLSSKRTLLRLGFSYTHDEFYLPTGIEEPCYALML